MIDKVIKIEDLLIKLNSARKASKKIVALSGSFDLIHAGHIDILYNAKQQGDILVVLLNSDSSIKLYKGSGRPIFNNKDRGIMLSANIYVDHIVFFNELTPLNLLKKIKPHIYANGSDYGESFLEKDTILENGGKIFVNKKLGASSNVLNNIKNEKQPQKAVFLDRDGVIIEDKNYLHQIDKVEFMPGIVQSLKYLQKKGYFLIGISNQSGIGRKMFTVKDCEKVNKFIIEKLKEEGVEISEIFYCPHSPEKKCKCRKPEIGLFLEAAKKYDIALGRSWMVGDKLSDIEAGKMVNAKTILINSNNNLIARKSAETPDYTITKLTEIKKIIV
jgi:D-glycero-D-manno-heptose 1,7-bisphosphate phosphatase